MAKNERRSDLLDIKERRLYVGSGVEHVIDNTLRTELDEFGQYHADYATAQDNIANVVYNSEVSRNEDDIAKTIFSDIPSIAYDKTIGFYLDLYVGHVLTGTYRKRGSSGGLVSWLAIKLLENKKIDGLIHVKKSKNPDILFEYDISRTPSEVRDGAKSRYYPAQLSEVLSVVKKKPGKYAVVGIPEIITELRLLAENDAAINKSIVFYFGLVAGHQKTTKYAEAIAWEYGIKPGNLKEIDFRVKRDTGRASDYDTKFTGMVDGKEKSFLVRGTDPFVSSWAHGFFKARFSDFTDNTFNEVADVTFGDAWLKEYVDDAAGNNVLIVRNTEIAELITRGSKNGELQLDIVDADTIIRSQKGLVHHTKDELPYRLHKEYEQYGWAPKKRVKKSDSLSDHRKKVQDIRQEIAEKSHIYYQRAVERDDFGYFRRKMQPYTDKYDDLYGVERMKRKKVKADGAILTLPGYYNYGNVIQRYALQAFLKNNGLNFISYIHSKVKNQRTIYKHPTIVYAKAPLRFVKRALRQQKPYWYFAPLSERHKEIKQEINLVNFVNKYIKVKEFNEHDQYDTYIVGSDQVWRKWRNDREMLGYYFLNFLKGRKANRIAYAASFGKDKINEVMSENDVEYVQPYVEEFDAISVREKSAIAMIKKAWGVDGVVNVLDPTLLLEQSAYSRLINKNKEVKAQEIPPLFSYVLDETPEVAQFVDRAKGVYGEDIVKIGAHSGAGDEALPPVELWLKGFRDARLVITNSFHGMMFSIINNTDFIIIGRKDGGLSRIKDFMSEFGIEGRLIEEEALEAFDFTALKPLNWESINQKLKEQRKYSGDWLLRAIKKNTL